MACGKKKMMPIGELHGANPKLLDSMRSCLRKINAVN